MKQSSKTQAGGADRIRAKLAKLNVTERDIARAVAAARRAGPKQNRPSKS